MCVYTHVCTSIYVRMRVSCAMQMSRRSPRQPSPNVLGFWRPFVRHQATSCSQRWRWSGGREEEGAASRKGATPSGSRHNLQHPQACLQCHGWFRALLSAREGWQRSNEDPKQVSQGPKGPVYKRIFNKLLTSNRGRPSRTPFWGNLSST